ncbi:MAG: hypothetical protein C0407_16195, partial [Desulfobacca sp.]|nr:hypothetical protein [Desulfobacca sp.]
TGAFAGYFLVLLTVFAYLYTNKEGEIWQVKGLVSFENGSAESNVKDLSILIKPPNLTINKDGTFQMDLLVKRGSGGKTVMPSLSIEHPLYKTSTAYLEQQPQGWNVNDAAPTYSKMDRIITLNKQIKLTQKEDN